MSGSGEGYAPSNPAMVTSSGSMTLSTGSEGFASGATSPGGPGGSGRTALGLLGLTASSAAAAARATVASNDPSASNSGPNSSSHQSGGNGSSGGDPNAVMNEKVQALAGSIYEEFESMMQRYDADVVKMLMPLIVNVLESLDLAYTENQEMEVECELLKEDNEQLVTQYEREKQLRKQSESRLMEVEDVAEGERKEAAVKVESLTSIVKMFELKAKNSQDQISRLDEKENEMKREYAKLHDRYTELFKTHIDYMERTKSMLGAERLEQLQQQGGHVGSARSRVPGSLAVNQINNRSSGPVSFGFAELENNNGQPSITPGTEYPSTVGVGADTGQQTLQNELQDPESKKSPPKRQTHLDKGKVGGWVETPEVEDAGDLQLTDVTSPVDVSADPSIGPATPATPTVPAAIPGSSKTKSETRTGNTLYQELSFQDSEAIGEVDEGADITGGWAHPGEYASADNESEYGETRGFENVNDNYFGMGKEVENLIAENNELLATKNALNIVKDDLIAKVDELTGEHEILREEIKSLQGIRTKLETKVKDVEDELKKAKEDAEKAAKAAKNEDDEEDVPMAQRKRFTRVEMARVLMERNQYKEKFMELQEAVRWTEMIRANKTGTEAGPTEPGKKGQWGIRKFFGNLFSGPSTGTAAPAPTPSGEGPFMKYSSPAASPSGDGEVGPALSTMRARSTAERKGRNADIFDGDTMSSSRRGAAIERKEQYKQVRAHVKKDDGRMQAYGWSLPARQPPTVTSPSSSSKGEESTSESGGSRETQVQSRATSSGVPVPVPVYCRPLTEKEPGMKIWCAAGVDRSGGRTKDGGDVVGASIFYKGTSDDVSPSVEAKEESGELDKLDKELAEAKRVADEDGPEGKESRLSSHVWICTSTHAVSRVTVIDANSPADVLEAFHVCSSHLLCISSVPGAKEDDYKVDDELNRLVVARSEEQAKAGLEEKRAKEAERTKAVLAGVAPEDVPGGGGIGSISFVSCATGDDAEVKNAGDKEDEEEEEEETPPRLTKETAVQPGTKLALDKTLDVMALERELSDEPDPHATLPFISHHTLNLSRDLEDTKAKQQQKGLADIEEEKSTDAGDAVHRRLKQRDSNASNSSDRPAKVKDGVQEVDKSVNEIAFSEVEKMSSLLPTMWLGSQSGSVYVHSAVAQWKRCIHSIRLKDSVLCIVHVRGRVLCSLADGSIAIFHRSPTDGQWDLTNYHLLDLGKPHHSIRTMIQVHNKVWCGYRNRVFVVDPKTMSVEKCFDAHPRKESQVRQMAWVGDGVWVSIRLDSTLRLYHAHTHEHLQDVDIEPYVSKMLGTGKLGFSFVRITALLVSNYRLWMGTGNGVIISVPLNKGGTSPSTEPIADALKQKPIVAPGEVVRVYSDSRGENMAGETFIPYCNMAHAQLSFHGHRDAVKFFVSVPGHGGLALNPTSSASSSPVKDASSIKEASSMLVMSGGEGYIDFRIVDDGSDQDYDSHIMVWQLPCSEARPPNHPPMITNPINQTLSITTPTSTTSSSIDLAAHTPGSGVITVDSDGDNSEKEDQSVIELAVDAAEDACDSYANWNKDVQSMLDRVGTNTNPPSEEEEEDDDDERKEESVGTNNSPKEDFSQHINTNQTMPGR